MKDFKIQNKKIETGFSVPEGYFDTLNELVLQKTVHKKQPKVILMWQKNKKIIMAVAAVFVIAFSIPYIYNYYQLQNNTTTEIENYLTYNTTMSDYELAEVLDEATIEKIDITISNSEEIENELLNTTNIEQIIN